MSGIKIAIDRGGTFTDCVGSWNSDSGRKDVIIKLLSVDPQNYSDANLEGIRRLMEIYTGHKIPRGQPLDTSKIEHLRLGTTVATNALLERKGERCALVTTSGFKDILRIGNQSRPHIFDLSIAKPEVIYDTVVEIDERVTLEDFVEDPENKFTNPNGSELVKGLSGETVRVLKKPNVDEIKTVLTALYGTGVKSLAVCLLHSYTFPDHELLIGQIAKEIGFTHISLSHKLIPMIKLLPRTNSSVADAYLTPEIQKYLAGFESGLKDGLFSAAHGKHTGVKCQFMQSDGGLVDASAFSGLRAILSGPAGGVVGYSKTCYNPKNKIPLIGFDMGGTSTDVSRFGDGKFDHVFETTTAGITIQSPQLDINTVAAGGGSILAFKNGLLTVGPESASSHPGPACYRKGGPLTITDANVVLGRLVPEYFPKIFGPNEDEPLDIEVTTKKFQELTDKINAANPHLPAMSVHEAAWGFLKVANETMARPVRQLTEAKGHILSKHRLVSFGGAGGQCACDVAELLGISLVLVHRFSSVLSAYGMALADVVEEVQEPSSYILKDETKDLLEARLADLKEQAIKSLVTQGFEKKDITCEEYLNLRYQGTESGLMVVRDQGWDFKENFFALHKREFGFVFDKDIIVDDIRVRAIGKGLDRKEEYVDDQLEELASSNKLVSVSKDKVQFVKTTFWGKDHLDTPVYRLEELEIGTQIKGPAIVADGTQTNVIPPKSIATVLESHLVIELAQEKKAVAAGDQEIVVEPVLLSIFGHRFMDIAEQMGISLQKTSVSVNVKERLDFSCALFDPKGNLVANAPHVPVHLGSMSTCVATQAKLWEGKLKPGDVLISNHPSAGGTHLPDITVVTPAFEGDKIIFYVASRAHHADIGGILPGSMPPNSRELWEEGATFYSELLVSNGEFQMDKITKIMLDDPAKYPGSSGTRRLSDNISDLKAQVAANQKGISLIGRLVDEFGLPTIIRYMTAIQENAKQTVSKMLDVLIDKHGEETLNCTDFMDDGSAIKLQVRKSKTDDKVIFDFSGTSPQANNNFNAPKAITYSAIIYCLRCLVDEDIPMNQGCLDPIEVIVPDSSLLSPDDGCAVVGGNVCTSQRITDTILKAFHVMADSQGCCNNFTFGTGGNTPDGKYAQGFGYYETIAGGHGASATWDGVSGVHTNMTNTRITDPEIFERRYPIILREFSIRKGSGGAGRHTGGDGVIREVEFRVPVTASILSERRAIAPHGLAGGEDGARGINLWIKRRKDADGNPTERIVNMGGRSSVNVAAGDSVRILTPGGGGYGPASEKAEKVPRKQAGHQFTFSGSLAARNRIQLEN
ncbi:hypothetical protein OGAPHI_004459 [Ogataea philodendri]|uniref:5-oxoprolinase n=1 Tax=Ogataea philodendri TaxID=1378263 RepID=A0A9P8P6R7_9ASCO|nr:uncharacterized protein OGAPHI_004459 [Ogataea philodendri]KAH3666270.1 hypothetical protein OGAPHI_004459 [Ogataea philodendri]